MARLVIRPIGGRAWRERGSVEATVIARRLDAIHTDASLTVRAFFEAHTGSVSSRRRR